MVPIEYVALLLVLVFGFVGFVRKFPRELGATVGYAAMLFMLAAAERYLGDAFYDALMRGDGGPANLALGRWFVYMGVIVLWVVILYSGDTLTFAGRWPPNPFSGAIFDIAVGLFNGWLVIWTAWHYTHILGYPSSVFGLIVPTFSARAESWVRFSVPAILPEAYAMWLLGGFLTMLIMLRVLK